jgi:hypothetical protein
MRRLTITVIVLALVVAGAVVVSRVGGRDTSASTDTTSRARPDTPESGVAPGAVAEVPEVDIAGARRAAITAVALTDDVVTARFISRRDLIAGFTTPGFGSRLADATSDQVNALLVELGDREADPTALVALEQPLTATATATSSGVRVEVWSVLIVAAPGTGPARQAWRTVTVDMVDVDGRWLVDSWTSTPGPTPALPAEVALDSADVVAVRMGDALRVGG